MYQIIIITYVESSIPASDKYLFRPYGFVAVCFVSTRPGPYVWYGTEGRCKPLKF